MVWDEFQLDSYYDLFRWFGHVCNPKMSCHSRQAQYQRSRLQSIPVRIKRFGEVDFRGLHGSIMEVGDVWVCRFADI